MTSYISILTPILYGISAYIGHLFSIDYPNIIPQGLPFDERLAPVTLTYILILLLLWNFKVASQKHLGAAETLIVENQKLASIDFLTSLPNRRKHSAVMEEVFQKNCTSEYNKSYVLVAAIDIDDFKHINDSFGHQSGDAVLKAVAHGLHKLQSDSVAVARVGGDEFTLAATISNPENIPKFVTELVDSLPQKAKSNDIALNFTYSIGVYFCKVSDFNIDTAISRSDYALYKAKSKNGVSSYIFSLNDLEEIERSQKSRATVKERIEENQLRTHYQLMMPTGQKPAVVEALLYINDDNGFRIDPASCIEAVDWLGLTDQFTRKQLESCILDVMAISDTLRLSFNLSPSQLQSKQIFSIVRELLEETKFGPERLILEISELTAYSESIIDVLKKLKELGVLLAIDDFGVGQTCFQIFNKIEFDIIKIDKSLLSAGPEKTLNRFILQQATEYCRKFGVDSVCEGVESSAMLEEMNGFGFDYFQGYFVSRPSNLIAQVKILKQGLGAQKKLKLYKTG